MDLVVGGPDDNIISPSTLIFLDANLPAQYLENATVNVYGADIVYGKQYRFLGNSRRLFFEWYVGGGIRLKSIRIEELGYYDAVSQVGGPGTGVYYPLSTPKYFNESEIFPDLKFGIMIGFAL